MKLKLISDGTPIGTKIVDEETGEMLHGISNLTWEVSANEPLTKLTLELFNVPVEISATANVEVQKLNVNNCWEHSETVSKDISVLSKSKEGKNIVTSYDTKIIDSNSKENVSGIQSVKLAVTPQKVSLIASKLQF